MFTLKTLLTEGNLENIALEFLKDQIKGTKYQSKVFLAGGGVRDELLGMPIKDIDLTVELPNGGIEFANWITKKLKIQSKTNPVIFPRFGTAKFNLRGIKYKGEDLSSIDIEVVMTRKERYADNSRKPDVSPGTLKQDVERRDFTVNSLLKDLSTGEILDLTGMGKSDIKAGVIRTPLNPDIIFGEDPLRMLRAVRFAVKYNWNLPMFMLRALKKNAAKLKNISVERIKEELDKMLLTKSPDRAVKLLSVVGLMDYVAPELNILRGMKQNKYHKHDAFEHTLEVVRTVPPDLTKRLAALFHDIGKSTTKTVIDNEIHFYKHEEASGEIVKDILTRLHYPNNIIDAVVIAVKNHMRLKSSGKEGKNISDKALRKLQRDLGDHLEDTLDIMHADNIAHKANAAMPEQIPSIRKRLSGLNAILPAKAKAPVDGNDILALGIKAGPKVKEIKDDVTDYWLENPSLTKQELLTYIKKKYL
ncbi:MAG: CCA tRNA nucleotidyltransferase [Methanogenium sp.]